MASSRRNRESQKGKGSGNSKGSRSGKDLIRTQSRSNSGTTFDISLSVVRLSFKPNNQGLRTPSHGSQGFPETNLADETLDEEFIAPDSPTIPDTSYIVDRQEYDLLGLEFSSFNTQCCDSAQEQPMNISSIHFAYGYEHRMLDISLRTSNSMPDNYVAGRKVLPNTSASHSQISICPIHASLLENQGHASSTLRGRRKAPVPRPIDRYLAEGPAQRYAIVNFNAPDTGEWTRYSKCRCPDMNAIDITKAGGLQVY